MTIQQLLQDTQMSRYRLSKISGIPWANSNLWADLITEEQASYLREKYLGTEGKENIIND